MSKSKWVVYNPRDEARLKAGLPPHGAFVKFGKTFPARVPIEVSEEEASFFAARDDFTIFGSKPAGYPREPPAGKDLCPP